MFPEKQQRLIILRKYFRFTGKITLIKIISTGILIFLLITDSVSGIFSTDDLQVKKSAADIQAEGYQTQGHQADAQPDPFAGSGIHGRCTTWEG